MTHYPVQICGSNFPSHVLQDRPEDVVLPGIRLADGRIQCGGCGSQFDDNSAPGLLPSCRICWKGIQVSTSE